MFRCLFALRLPIRVVALVVCGLLLFWVCILFYVVCGYGGCRVVTFVFDFCLRVGLDLGLFTVVL